jgi:hypothetical protein
MRLRRGQQKHNKHPALEATGPASHTWLTWISGSEADEPAPCETCEERRRRRCGQARLFAALLSYQLRRGGKRQRIATVDARLQRLTDLQLGAARSQKQQQKRVRTRIAIGPPLNRSHEKVWQANEFALLKGRLRCVRLRTTQMRRQPDSKFRMTDCERPCVNMANLIEPEQHLDYLLFAVQREAKASTTGVSS